MIEEEEKEHEKRSRRGQDKRGGHIEAKIKRNGKMGNSKQYDES